MDPNSRGQHRGVYYSLPMRYHQRLVANRRGVKQSYLTMVVIILIGVVSAAIAGSLVAYFILKSKSGADNGRNMCCQGLYASNSPAPNTSCPRPLPGTPNSYVKCDNMCCNTTCTGSTDIMRYAILSKCTLSNVTWNSLVYDINSRLQAYNASCELTCTLPNNSVH